MNILNHLIKEKSVVGLELNDSVIRVAYFHPIKKFIPKRHADKDEESTEKRLVLIEEVIPVNTILNGIVKDKELLTKILRNIWKKEKLSSKCAIVSIPEDKIYSNLFTFPKTVNDEHLKQAIDLAIDFKLPFKREDIYLGWENTFNSSTGVNDVIISTIPKAIADNYIKVLNNAGIDILALESHLFSIARSIKLNSDEATLISKTNQNSLTIFCLKNNALDFSRTIPKLIVSDDKLIQDETDRIKNSIETEYKEKLVELSLENSRIKDEYQKFLGQDIDIEVEQKWLISVGAAIRGEIPKEKDNAISLLPIGTIEAYRYQKIKTFIALMRNMIIGVSIFFVFAFLASYFFIFSLSQTIKNVSLDTPIYPTSGNLTEKEALIDKVNSLTLVSSGILATNPDWSIIIDDINSRTVLGITISNFSAPSISDKISIAGTATTRDILNQFKKLLQGSPYLSNVELPITNLEQKSDIPFSITFSIKNPSMLYNK